MSDKDKRELLKLKQGLISEDDSRLLTEEREKVRFEKPTGRAAVSNFFYHYKIHIWVAVFFLTIVGFLVYFTLSAEKADIKILIIADSEEASMFFAIEAEGFERAIENYTPDFNGDGNIHAECMVVDLTTKMGEIQRDPNVVYGNRVKLFGEVQRGEAVIYVGNKQALEGIPGEGMKLEDFYINLKEYFSDFNNPNADGVFFKIKGSSLESVADFERVPLPEDLYLAIRISPSENKNSKNALMLAEGILDPH